MVISSDYATFIRSEIIVKYCNKIQQIQKQKLNYNPFNCQFASKTGYLELNWTTKADLAFLKVLFCCNESESSGNRITSDLKCRFLV